MEDETSQRLLGIEDSNRGRMLYLYTPRGESTGRFPGENDHPVPLPGLVALHNLRPRQLASTPEAKV